MKRVVIISEENRYLGTWLSYFLDLQEPEVQLDIVTNDVGIQLLKNAVYDALAFIVMDTLLDASLTAWLEKHPCRNIVVLSDLDTDRVKHISFSVADKDMLPYVVVQTYLPILTAKRIAVSTMVVVVTSVIGGCGTTAIARACVRELERKGVSVIYIETHAFRQFEGTCDHVSSEQLLHVLEKGIYAQYQVIVIDMTWCHNWEDIVSMAHKVCVVTTGDERAVRTQNLLKRLESQDKYMVVDNVLVKNERFICENNWQYCCVTQADIENKLPAQLVWWLQGGLSCM